MQTTYGYDGNSNRTHVNGSAIANYDAQDRMLSYADATYTYTPNGELQQKNLNGQTTEYRYDTGSNLQQVTAGGQTIRYIIDGNDRRIGKTVNGTLQRTWVYQGSTNPAASFAADGQLLGQYIYATLDNMPDYVLADGVLYRYITDHLGSVRLLVDVATGAIVQRSYYDAWGEMQRDVELAFQPFGFAGGVYDADTGLVRFGARDYDAEVGRWTLQDPIGHASQAVNLYAYVYNDPINHVDSSGLFVPYLVGCFLRGAGMSAATQLLWEGRGVECLDWEEILWDGLSECIPFPLKIPKLKGKPSPCSNSFIGETLVHTSEGLQPISELAVGDKVLAYDERTEETAYQPVMEIIQSQKQVQLFKLTFENSEVIETTEGHPFYIQGKGWQVVANLKVGDAIQLYNGITVVLSGIDISQELTRVFNLEVANLHNFFVGDAGILVHNSTGKRRKNRLDDKGEPNTVAENASGTTRKKYDSNGNTQKEWNKGHGQHAPPNEQDDHIHDYKPNPHNPSGRGERMPGRKPRMRDLYDMCLL